MDGLGLVLRAGDRAVRSRKHGDQQFWIGVAVPQGPRGSRSLLSLLCCLWYLVSMVAETPAFTYLEGKAKEQPAPKHHTTILFYRYTLSLHLHRMVENLEA